MAESDNIGERFIVSVAVPRPLDTQFTYGVSQEQAQKIKIGSWVKVPFGRVQTHAFVVDSPKPLSELSSEIKPGSLKNVLEVGTEDSVIPADVFALCQWAHEYYGTPLGEVLNAAIPAASLGRKNVGPVRALHQPREQLTAHALTLEQEEALAILEKTRVAGGVALLHGVTGSGKTELYIELAKRTLREKKGVLLLVPEIALTSQLHRRFEEHLGVPVGLWHSAMPAGKRRDQTAALRSGELKVIVGARSAVFAPVKNLGLIVVDEEHDPTYKQEDRFRYHARDLAVVRGKMNRVPVILGSATPSIETRERVIEGRYQQASLKKRIASGGLPTIEIVDLCSEAKIEGTQAILAERTIRTIQDTLDAGEQVMVFLNRRGFASFLICQDCGEVAECPNCSISLTVHKRPLQLKCHVCAYQAPIPHQCAK
jgi:primosomal protein N'